MVRFYWNNNFPAAFICLLSDIVNSELCIYLYTKVMAAGSESGLSEEAAALSVASLWKGENDSDAEQMEAYDSNPLA